MSGFRCSLIGIIIFVCFVSSFIQISGAPVDSDEDDEMFLNQNKPYKRKSARMAFLEESDDPMFKFLTKILNTAQLRTKNRLARAQNGIKEARELKTAVANKLRMNHMPRE